MIELSKEIRAQRIAGPFDKPPISNLQCSGLGVIPKKTGGWRMIICTCQLHLRPCSINNGMTRGDFPSTTLLLTMQ